MAGCIRAHRSSGREGTSVRFHIFVLPYLSVMPSQLRHDERLHFFACVLEKSNILFFDRAQPRLHACVEGGHLDLRRRYSTLAEVFLDISGLARAWYWSWLWLRARR